MDDEVLLQHVMAAERIPEAGEECLQGDSHPHPHVFGGGWRLMAVDLSKKSYISQDWDRNDYDLIQTMFVELTISHVLSLVEKKCPGKNCDEATHLCDDLCGILSIPILPEEA